MTSKLERQQALIEATASLRLEGLPISTRDDDLYAVVVEGTVTGPLRDVVAARIHAELAPNLKDGASLDTPP